MSASVKILVVVGARPQFIKAAAVSRVLGSFRAVREVLVHTGQHYDYGMSEVFFAELGIPPPAHHLGIGSGSHGRQTGRMVEALEIVLERERPDWVLVYGDTNSTLAGAIVAAQQAVPLAHVEAGLRSYNRRMPEEINRVVTDHLASLLLCPTTAAVSNLASEGIVKGVHLVGDVMYDSVLFHAARLGAEPSVLRQLGVRPKSYYLATIHRAENTNDRERLEALLESLSRLPRPTLLPMHPRTRKTLGGEINRWENRLKVLEPVGYLDMLALVRGARVVLTDSGGVQKEAYWLRVPCVTLRDETEWIELVESGWNRLAGTSGERIHDAVVDFEARDCRGPEAGPDYGGGRAAERIARLLAGDAARVE